MNERRMMAGHKQKLTATKSLPIRAYTVASPNSSSNSAANMACLASNRYPETDDLDAALNLMKTQLGQQHNSINNNFSITAKPTTSEINPLRGEDFHKHCHIRAHCTSSISLPVCHNENKLNCHCSACCKCPEGAMPARNRLHHQSLNWCVQTSCDILPESSDSSSSEQSLNETSPVMVSTWGYYGQPSGNRYKYRRSDYSSDSDDDVNVSMMSTPSCQVKNKAIHRHSPAERLKPKVWRNCIFTRQHSDPVLDVAAAESDKFATDGCIDGVRPDVFRHRLQTMSGWLSEFSNEQKNIFLKQILTGCDLPQLHLLSVRMEANLHRGCPPNCEDLITWLPSQISSKIFSYLDPVSLCHASQVCQVWRLRGDEASLWRRFCCQQKWRLSKPAEHKQVVSHMVEGIIQWKRVFAERFRLRNNWLRGRCTVRTFEGHTQGISCVQFDDTRIVSGSSDKTIKVWNIRTNAPWSVQTLVGHSGTPRCLHLEGNRLVSGSTDSTIKVWDLSTQDSWSSIACKVTMIGHTDTVRCLQVDDEKVISGSYDKTLKIWTLSTGECRKTLRGHQAAVLCVQYSDSKIVSGSCDKTIKVWNFDGDCVTTLMGHQDAVTCLQFDSTRIVSGSLDCNLKFWDIRTGQCVNTIDWKASEGHTGVVRCLQADSWRLVSAADDKTLKVWNLETGERLVTLRNHTDGVTCLQFNDFIIVSGSYDKTVKLWDFYSC